MPAIWRGLALVRDQSTELDVNIWAIPMLPPFIIEQIRQREEEERARREAERPRLQLPIESVLPLPESPDADQEPTPQRGVVVLDL